MAESKDTYRYRSNPPEIGKLKSPDILCPTRHKLTSVPLYYVRSDDLSVVCVQFCFRAGTTYQDRPLQSVTCNAMLSEGTRKRTASEIADTLDAAGAYLETSVDDELGILSVYTLADKLLELMPLVKEIIAESNYPKKELAVVLEQKKQEFLINSEKVAVIAGRTFRNLIFEGHPYGTLVSEEDFGTLSRSHVKSFFAHCYVEQPVLVTLAGAVDDRLLDVLSTDLEGLDNKTNAASIPNVSHSVKRNCRHIEKKGAVQAAIRIGRPFHNLHHPDFTSMQMLCMVLGGYFGSRLMNNLREDHGYTYGIHAQCRSHPFGGVITIGTEVGSQYLEPTLKEIYGEVDRLKEERVPESELNRVKQYVLGSYMRQFDGPFKQINRLRDIFPYGLDMKTYYVEKINSIMSLTPEDIRDTASRYLDKEVLTEVVCGEL